MSESVKRAHSLLQILLQAEALREHPENAFITPDHPETHLRLLDKHAEQSSLWK